MQALPQPRGAPGRCGDRLLDGDDERARAARIVDDGLLRADGDRLVLTDRGRLLADAVVRDLLV